MLDITAHAADALSRAIHSRQISCREVMQAYLTRIHRLNPHYNAIVSLASDQDLLLQSEERDRELSQGHSRGWLHGMPLAVKDNVLALGFPTTHGSALFRNSIAQQDGLMVARMKAAGGIVIGKTNMPEFGLGSHTFNEVFGPTPNAWDTSVSAGGSSGGAAVALAQRMLPVADGSDFMGSLRNPAAWNHVFGLRPSQGRVPQWPSSDVWLSQLATEGPMARTALDLARLLAIQSGPDARTPLAIAKYFDENWSLKTGGNDLHGLRIAWLADLEGYLPMDDGLLVVCELALQNLAKAGAEVTLAPLGFDPQQLWSAWLVWRQALIGSRVADYLALPGASDLIKPEALWEYEQSQHLGIGQFMQASKTRSAFYAHLLKLFERFDMLALPATQVWPFPLRERWPHAIAGRKMDTYHRWMEVTIYATLAGLPALSLPAGFHPNGHWPAGLQLIGRPHQESSLLDIAATYETLVPELLGIRPPELKENQQRGVQQF